MFPVIAGTVIGAWLVARTKPQTRVIKREALGTRSGLVYSIEEFPEAGLVIAKIRGACVGVLERSPSGGFIIRKVSGTPAAVEAFKRDFTSSEL